MGKKERIYMKAKEQKTPLSQRQLLGMKPSTLEAKIISYFEFSQDVSSVIKYLVITMMRNALITTDFSFLCRELICDLFMTAEPNDAMRKYCSYFEDYFKKRGDWDKVIRRLFADKKEYYRLSEEVRSYKKILDTSGTNEVKNPDHTIRLVSVFEDAAGKKHTLTLRDADERRSKAEINKILEIMTTVDLFETATGVRRFMTLVKANRPGTIETLDEEEVQDESQVESVQNSETESKEKKTIEIVVSENFDPEVLSEKELLAMIRVGHPDVVSLQDVHVVFTEQESEVTQSDEDVEMQEPILEPVIDSNSPQPALNDSSQSKSSTGVSDPPATDQKKPKKRKRLTAKQAYAQSVIENRGNNIQKGSGKNKKNKNGKKNKKKRK